MEIKNASLALINRVVAEWQKSAKWPLTAVLRVQVNKEKQNLDELVRGIPFDFYRSSSDAGVPESERLILSPAAVELADGGLADVMPLLELIRRGVKRRLADPYRRAFVTTDDLKEILGPTRLKDLPRLQEYFADFWAGGGGISHEPALTKFSLDLHSIRYESVNSGEQYVALLNPQPRVQNWDQLDDAHRDLVRLIYEHWRKHVKWPLLVEFMVEHRDKGDVYTKLRELPSMVLDTRFSPHEDQLAVEVLASLRLRFLGFCVAAKDAEPALFVRMLPIFHEHYEATVGSTTAITADEVAQRLGEPVEAIRRLSPLLDYEGHAGIIRRTSDDDPVWAVRLTRDIDEWYEVKTIDEYINRRVEHDNKNSTAEQVVARLNSRALGAVPQSDQTEPADFDPARCMSMAGLSEIEEKAVRFALENARIDGRSTSKKEFDRLIADESHFLLRRLHDLHFLRWDKTNLYPTLRAILGDRDRYAEVIRALEKVIEFGKSVFQQDRENINVDEIASALVDKHKGLGYTPTRFLFDCGLASFYPAMSVVQFASNGVPAVVCFHGVVQRMTKLDDVLAAQQREQQVLEESSADFTLGPERAPGRVRQLLDELEQSYDVSSPLQAILRRDADEVEGARRALLHKSVLLLSGSILESVLVDVLGKRIDLAQPLFERGKKRKPKFPDEASLRDLLELATSAELPASCGPLLSAQVMKLGESVIDHRDLIHPHREVREAGNITIDEHTAEALYNVLCLVLRDVAKAAKSGWMHRYVIA